LFGWFYLWQHSTCHVRDADKRVRFHYFYQILTNIWKRWQNSSTPNLLKICSAVPHVVCRHGGDNSCIWNISLQLHKIVVDNNRFTVTFTSKIAALTVRVLNYVANCLQIVYTLPHILLNVVRLSCSLTKVRMMYSSDSQSLLHGSQWIRNQFPGDRWLHFLNDCVDVYFFNL
jgi:hypothetical protein